MLLSHTQMRSTIAAEALNDRVREGNVCFFSAIDTRKNFNRNKYSTKKGFYQAKTTKPKRNLQKKHPSATSPSIQYSQYSQYSQHTQHTQHSYTAYTGIYKRATLQSGIVALRRDKLMLPPHPRQVKRGAGGTSRHHCTGPPPSPAKRSEAQAAPSAATALCSHT